MIHHNAMIGEISSDLRMGENTNFTEGMFRLKESEWQVFLFSRYAASIAEDVVMAASLLLTRTASS
jgi:hypothetical protein